MEFQSVQCHFGSSPRHLLGRIQRELPADIAVIHICTQEGDKEEELPLYYQVPLSRILSWNRWWHITARALLLAYQKRFWGLVGNYLQEVVGTPGAHLALVRRRWGSGQGRLLRQSSKQAPKQLLGRLLCAVHYSRDSELKPGGIQGGFGSSSLKECIELLNATVRNSPAPLDSGVGQETSVPSQVMSPSITA